ncbi:unnamed protein product [Meloidogyne enterolobii]|uniref:Uncharacterized protein n=1 Tax=Meloidogyne enterolobii TaxID=390850 RepID=A0ACB0ZQB0_MELEN
MQKDGFRLEYLEVIGIDKITSKRKEEIFEEILHNSKLHKVTFTEANKLLESEIKSKILTETGLQYPNEIQSGMEININQQESRPNNYSEIVKFELNKIKEIFKKQKEEKEMDKIKRLTKDLRYINSEYFQQFEWKIKLKTECQKCSDFILIEKIFGFEKTNLDLNEKEKCKFVIEYSENDLVKDLKLNKNSEEAKQIEEIFKLLKLVKSLLTEQHKNLNKLFENLNKAINLIDNTNPMIAYFNELKEIEENAKFRAARILQFWKGPRKVIFDEKEIKRQDEIVEEMEKLIEDEENIKEFDERLKNKFDFLVKNWEKIFLSIKVQNEGIFEEEEKNIFYKQIVPESGEIKKKFEKSGPLFVGYCLTKRIENSFNKDGTVKFSQFLSNGVGQEYGWELKEVLGQKRIDIGHYENIQKQIKEKLENVCEEIFKNKCELFLEHELQYWHSFCSIDTEHLRFEHFEEMNVVTNGYQNKKEDENKDSFEEITFDEFGDDSKFEGEIEELKY